MRREKYTPFMQVTVCEDRDPQRTIEPDVVPCIIDKNVIFEPEGFQSYFTSEWEPIIYDGMLVAAAIEFCDRSKLRSEIDWARKFQLDVPVHDPDLWNSSNVRNSLTRAVGLLTGDDWEFNFRRTTRPCSPPVQGSLALGFDVEAVIPFSDGLDSLAVSMICCSELGNRLVRVRVGLSKPRKLTLGEKPKPFTSIPFRVVHGGKSNPEKSNRSRGFKFAMISGLAAYLVRATKVIIPESGQGALGPVLAPVGQAYQDRRTHPQFSRSMTVFLETLLGQRILFEHPMLWDTKGETLARYRKLHPDDEAWRETRSCWQDARHASVDGERRQCGICAACMLRRVSLHAAGLDEPPESYLWEDLGVSNFWEGTHKDFVHRNNAMHRYAIAGALHMDHLAGLRRASNFDTILSRQALTLSKALGIPFEVARGKIVRLLIKHENEWSSFVSDLPPHSFLRNWANAA